MRRIMAVVLFGVICFSAAYAGNSVEAELTGSPAGNQAEKSQNKEAISEQVPLPIDFSRYVPMPLPEPRPPLSEAAPESEIVIYDSKTKTETFISIDEIADPDHSPSPGFRGLADGSGLDESDYQGLADAFSALSLIYNPEDFPWRVNVKLFITFDGGSYVASGTLIDPKHVITAGHCVHDIIHGGTWATNITVVPGFENGEEPYGYSHDFTLMTWVGWMNSADYNYDMGIISLERPVGILTGWYSYDYDDDTYFTTHTFNQAGYPAAPPYDGNYMYYWYGTFDEVTVNLLRFDNLAYGGQSGSGAYTIVSDVRTVYAELSHGTATWTKDVRITSAKYSGIESFITNYTSATVDLVPFDVVLSQDTLTAGEQLTTWNYLVYNNSLATYDGSVYADVYISTNSFISPADNHIQNHSFNWSFPAKSSVRVNNPPATIPSDLPTGLYYVGLILDFVDADEGNNDTYGSDTAPIFIWGADYEYLPGDVNMYGGTWPPSATGPDVTYLVNFFRGAPTSHACYLDGFWCSADANGDCNIIGSDVTKLVNVFRGVGSIGYCVDYEPAWPTPADLPPSMPPGWPGCETPR